MPIPRVIFDRVRDEIDRELADWVPRIVAEMHPERVILFGSAARGEAGEDSDVDLCIVAETDLKFIDRMRTPIGLYSGARRVEVFVYTPEEWRRMREEGRDFIRTIATEGRVLHESGEAKPK
jgi:predicted nucleotidyltransferase